MHTRRFISRIVKPIVPLAAYLLTLSSCFSNTIWNINQDEFVARLQRGDVQFLAGVDFSKAHLDDILRLGPNAPYYMAYVYRDLGMQVTANSLYLLEWHRGNGIWRRDGGEILAQRYLSQGDYAGAEQIASELYSAYPSRANYRLLLVAWYWQHKDAEVLRGIDKISTLEGSDGKPVYDPELKLFRAVASARLGQPGWPELFAELYSALPASDLHVRAFDFLTQNPEMKGRFDAQQLALFEAKSAIARQQFGPAVKLLEPLIADKYAPLDTRADLLDVGRAYMGSGRYQAGITVLQGLLAQLRAASAGDDAFYGAYQSLGHLERTSGDYRAAIDSYTRALQLAPNDYEKDRMLWYLLDSRLKRSPADAASALKEYARQWHSPAFFDDLLDELCTELVEARDWRTLYEAYDAMSSLADSRTLARYAFVVATAIRHGYLVVPDPASVEQSLYARVVALGGDRYYSILASVRLGRMPSYLAPDDATPALGRPQTPEDTDREGLVMGFLPYGLYHDAYLYARDWFDSMGPATIRLLAQRLNGSGHFIEALRLLDSAEDTQSFAVEQSDFKLLYPEAYSSIVREVAQHEQLKMPFFYALIREESYFDPSIISTAGAVGLSQLMPATAQDVAHRMRLHDPDLTKPDDNLAIGGHYFGMLLERFKGNIDQALFAYNAGYQVVQRWLAEYRGLPEELFLEAIPYGETQQYGRKILVSAVAYGYLYFGLAPADTIKEVFAGF